ncbi:TPA: FISUMP domain-containing protein, partial [Elizabethkingia anophelis]
GTKFVVVAYKFKNGDYVTHRTYTVGSPIQSDPSVANGQSLLMLNGGETYTIIAYSLKNKTVGFTSSQQGVNLKDAHYITLNDDGLDNFLLYKDTITPSGEGEGNKLDIVLRHKKFRVVVHVKDNAISNRNIESVTSSKMKGGFWYGSKFNFNDGSVSPFGDVPVDSYDIDFPTDQFGSSGVTSAKSKAFNGYIVSDNPVTFSTRIKIQGSAASDFSFSGLKLKNGYKHNINVETGRCGAYLGPGDTNWKEFMCQNLGSTLGVDPFSPEAGNHGAKYQWGAKTGETGRYISQADDQSNSGGITGWNSSPKPNGSWSDTTKTENDPCPSGYRVPTSSQWQAIVSNNNIERVGSFADGGTYTSALYIKNPSGERTLMLPAAGYRGNTSGSWFNAGMSGHYWSTELNKYLFFKDTDFYVNYGNLTSGFSVRCVAE